MAVRRGILWWCILGAIAFWNGQVSASELTIFVENPGGEVSCLRSLSVILGGSLERRGCTYDSYSVTDMAPNNDLRTTIEGLHPSRKLYFSLDRTLFAARAQHLLLF